MIQAALLSNWAFTPRCSETGTGRVKKDGEIPMSQTATASFDPRQRRQFGAALAILRIALGLFLLVWGLAKFIVTERSVAIYGSFYGISASTPVASPLGATASAHSRPIILCPFRPRTYGLALPAPPPTLAASPHE